jgi:hypothetical protein
MRSTASFAKSRRESGGRVEGMPCWAWRSAQRSRRSAHSSAEALIDGVTARCTPWAFDKNCPARSACFRHSSTSPLQPGTVVPRRSGGQVLAMIAPSRCPQGRMCWSSAPLEPYGPSLFAISPGGQSGHPLSMHYSDQHQRYLDSLLAPTAIGSEPTVTLRPSRRKDLG